MCSEQQPQPCLSRAQPVQQSAAPLPAVSHVATQQPAAGVDDGQHSARNKRRQGELSASACNLLCSQPVSSARFGSDTVCVNWQLNVQRLSPGCRSTHAAGCMLRVLCLSHAYIHTPTHLLLLLQEAPPSKPYRVAYQGVPGAYSEMAACNACPDAEPVPCEQFEVAFQVGVLMGGCCSRVGCDAGQAEQLLLQQQQHELAGCGDEKVFLRCQTCTTQLSSATLLSYAQQLPANPHPHLHPLPHSPISFRPYRPSRNG